MAVASRQRAEREEGRCPCSLVYLASHHRLALHLLGSVTSRQDCNPGLMPVRTKAKVRRRFRRQVRWQLALALALALVLVLLLLVVVLLRQVMVRVPAFCAAEAGGGLPPLEQAWGGKACFYSTRKHSSGL